MTYKVPIEIISIENTGFHPMITASFSGNYSLNLLVDTGASQSVFDQNLPQEYFADILEPDNHFSSGINAEKLDVKMARLTQLTIGAFMTRNYWVPLMDLSAINALYQSHTARQFGGLIGCDFLLRFRATLDFKKKTLTLRDWRKKIPL